MLTYLHPPDTAVPGSFRNLVLETLPALRDKLLLRLLDHILFGSYFDRQTGDLLMGWELLNSLRGPKASHDFSTTKLIRDFSEVAFTIEVASGSWHGKQAARLVRADVPTEIREARDRMLVAPGVCPLVGFVTGNPIDPRAERSVLKAEAERLVPEAKHRRIEALLYYLNDLPAELFDSVYARIADAGEIALNLTTPVARVQQTAMLHRLRSCPQPFYKPVATTARIYTLGTSFLNLASPVRARLTRQWAKLDLKQAQLMIVSHLWGQPGIRSYIERLDVSLWEDVCRWSMVDHTPENKAVFKTCVYSTTYGMETAKAKRNVAERLGDEVAKRCVSHPVVSSLATARKAKVSDLLLAGGCIDAFDNRLDVHDWPSGTTERQRALSILACQAQSFELPLLMPVVDYARGTEENASPLYVAGWLHDGIWLHCEDEELLDAHVGEAVRLIERESLSILGFEIGVDVEMPISE